MWRSDGFAFRHATKGIPTLEGEKTLEDAVRFVSFYVGLQVVQVSLLNGKLSNKLRAFSHDQC